MPQDVASRERTLGGVRDGFVRALIVVVTLALMAASAAGAYSVAEKLDFRVSSPTEVLAVPFLLETDAFTIEFPGAPVREESTLIDAGFEIPYTIWRLQRGDLLLTVHSGDYSDVVTLSGFDVEAAYDGMSDALVAEVGGTLVTSESLVAGGDSARRITVESAGSYGVFYFVLHGDTLVRINATADSAAPPPEFEAAIASLVWRS